MSDYKPHVVIDDQKNIILPEELKNHMVQFDHNVKTITFDCPRYSDGRDLSTMRIYVNYFRKSGEKDSDVCKNIKVDSKDTNLIHFEWVPKRSATLEAGVLAFLICAEKEDAEGNQENAWHTKLCKDLKIAEGIYCLKAVIEKYPTIITYLLTRMEDVESIATPEAMQTYVNQYLLENPPSGMTEEERALLEENIALTRQIQTDLATVDQSKADAIICTAEGSTIVATDSAEAGFEGLHLFGRSEQVTTTGAQLLDMSEAVGGTDAGITVTVNDDGSYTMSGTATAETANVWLLGYYGSTTTLFTLPAGTYYLKDVRLYNGSTAIGPSTNGSFTLNSDTNITGVRCVGSLTIGTTYNTTKYPMINSGTEALPWEPYTGGKASPSVEYPQEIVSAGDDGSVEVGVYGKNLYDASQLLLNSADYLTVSDNTITVTGTRAHSSAGYKIKNADLYKGKTMTLSYESALSTNPSVDYCVQIVESLPDSRMIYHVASPLNDGKTTFKVSDNAKYLHCKVMPNNSSEVLDTANTVTFVGVMFNVGAEALPYEPYKGQPITISTPNGLPGIKVTDVSLATYTDENGQMWCADEIDFERGVYVKRVTEQTITTCHNVTGTNSDNVCAQTRIEVDTYVKGGHQDKVMSNRFCGKPFSYGDSGNECICIANNAIRFYLSNERGVTTTDDVNDLLQSWVDEGDPLKIIYPLATPIETPLSDEEILAYKSLHTNYPTTTVMNSENVHMKVDYVADTKNHIKQNYVPLSEYTALEERVAAIEELVIS